MSTNENEIYNSKIEVPYKNIPINTNNTVYKNDDNKTIKHLDIDVRIESYTGKDIQYIENEKNENVIDLTGLINDNELNTMSDNSKSRDMLKGCPEIPEEEVKKNNKACKKKYINGTKFNDYSAFKECLIDKYTEKQHRDSRYATQGCAQCGEYVLTTSYDTRYADANGGKSSEKKPSILDIKDGSGTKYKTLYFDDGAHVGGIAYDEKSDKIIVSGTNCIKIYDYDYVASLEHEETLTEYTTYHLTKEKDGITKASYMNIYEGNLYVGEFSESEVTNLVKYSIGEDGELTKTNTYKVHYENVQGVCVTEYNGEEYYFFSCSFGRKKPSYLYVATLDGNGFETKGIIMLPPMSEQVSVDSDGNLMIVFESDCIQYGDGADGKGNATMQVGNVCYLDVDKVIKNSRNLMYIATDNLTYLINDIL